MNVERLEECRMRLQSVELLTGSSPRDALLLARALLEDVAAQGELPEAAREPLKTARRSLEGTPGAQGLLDGAASLRQLVGALGRSGVLEAGAGAGAGAVAVAGAGAVAVAGAGAGAVAGAGAGAARQSSGSGWLRAGLAVVAVAAVALFVLLRGGGEEKRVAEFNARFTQASALEKSGNHAGAVEMFGKAIDALPGKDRTADAWNDLGWSLQEIGRYEAARDAYRTALQLRPAFPLARNNLDAAQRQIDLTKSAKPPQ